MAINYKNGKIYKIEPRGDHSEGDVYIGSTTKEYLCQRMTAHRSGYNCFKRGTRQHKLTSYDLFDKYGVENCDIILLELVEANSKHLRVLRAPVAPRLPSGSSPVGISYQERLTTLELLNM